MIDSPQYQVEEQKVYAVAAAGEWLVHLCQKEGALGRTFTALEETKFNEFFQLHSQHEAFKKYHIQALYHSLSGKDYRLVRALLAKDDTQTLLLSDSSALQIAIKSVRIPSKSLAKSPKESSPQLLDIVKLLMHHGAAANSLDQDGNSPLFYACVLGYEELFRLLCDSGANVWTIHRRRTPDQLRSIKKNRKNKKNKSKANEQVQGNVNLLQVTLDALISPHQIMYHPGTSFDFPLWELGLEATWGPIVLNLLRKGLACAPDDIGLIKLLHISCYQGALDYITSLLEFGASIDTPDQPFIDERGCERGIWYGSALHAASDNLQIPAAQKLLQHGADPRAQRPCSKRYYHRSQDLTPVRLALDRAGRCDGEEICSAALEFCKVIMQTDAVLDEEDYLALLEFCARNNRVDVLRQLVQRGIRPAEMPDTDSLEVILLLSEQGVKVDHSSLQKEAVKHNRLDILRWSVNQHGGLLPSDPEGWGSTMLWVVRMVELLSRTPEMLKFLICDYPGPHIDTVLEIPCGEEADSKSAKTNSLQIALNSEDVETVRIVLDAGANVRCPGLPEDGLTAFQRKTREKRYWRTSMHRYLEIIYLVQEKMLNGASWTPPSVTETRAKSKEIIDRQRRVWERRIEELIESRGELPKMQNSRLPQTEHDATTYGARHVYPYGHLTGTSSIRLLELLPSTSQTSPLEGRLFYSDITHRPQYEALSYVWGEPDFKDSLSLDDHQVSITRNLHSALVHIRHKVDKRILWVDALCINQSNISERNQQVRIMGDIYRGARNVLVWLGEAADDSHLVFARIEEGYSSVVQLTDQERRAWKALITRPWFFRTWVIQEVALNRRSTIIMCGDDSAPWLQSSPSIDFSSGIPRLGTTTIYHSLGGIDFDARISSLSNLEPKSSPSEIMKYSMTCESSDIRDRVYGILGLFEPDFMTIDYKLHVEEIFRRFAEASIRLDGNLHILQASGFQRHLSSLPTWVPDLSTSTPLGTLPTDYFSRDHDNSEYKEFTLRQTDGSISTFATTGFPIKILPGLTFRDDGALVVRGKLVDTISTIGPELPSGIEFSPRPPKNSAHSGTRSFSHVLRQWESLAVSLIPSWGRFGPKSVTEAFAVTLVADKGELGNTSDEPTHAFSEYAEGFAQWYRLCGTGVLEAADPAGFLRDVEFFMEWAGTDAGDFVEFPPPRELGDEVLSTFVKAVESTIYDRRFFVTEGGSMGLAAPGARVGDRIAYIPGASQPFVLRALEGGKTWTMHGDCYLYGLDVYALFEDDQHVVEEFVIR